MRVDHRIAGACRKLELAYTRYVDDITISGAFPFDASGIPTLVERILAEDGFRTNVKKRAFGTFKTGMTVTGLRTINGHLDVRQDYLSELERQLEDAHSLACDKEFLGPYYTQGQILGKVRFVCWVNAGRRHALLAKYRSIAWNKVRENAVKRGLEACRPKVTKALWPRREES
jgi:hypothetical protein